MPTPDRELARELLERHWSDVVQGRTACVVAESTAARIDALIGSETVTFTYSLPTQLLGKLTDHRLDALCLQRGDNSESQWDPRSFAAGVVVPWVRDNENMLGNSADPYVSNPLRQPRIQPRPPNVKPNTLPLWASLHEVLSEVQIRDDPAYTEDVFCSVLRVIFERLKDQQFDYPTLPRASRMQASYLVREILKSSQAGEHGMSVSAALFTVAGRQFALWDNVRREESTTADHASGMVADLECRRGGVLVYAVEVKERRITVADVRSLEDKLNPSSLTEALVVAPTSKPQDAVAINRRLRLMWTRGVSLHHHPIESLVDTLMSFMGEDGRRDFIVEIGHQLDAYAQPSGRLAWRNLLMEVLDGNA